MTPLALTGNWKLAAAIVLGVLLGVILTKSELSPRKKILEGLRFNDSTLFCTFLFSIAVGAGIFYLAAQYGVVRLHVRPAFFWGALGGGVIAGLGVAVCGGVPMTAVAELASGKMVALWTLVGFLLAIPVVRTVGHWIDNLLSGWSKPLAGGLPVSAALCWTVLLCLGLALLLQFVLGGAEKSGKK